MEKGSIAWYDFGMDVLGILAAVGAVLAIVFLAVYYLSALDLADFGKKTWPLMAAGLAALVVVFLIIAVAD